MLPDLTPWMLAWIAVAGLLHAVTTALFVKVFTPYRPRAGFIGGLVPDFDVVFLLFSTSFPFVHRGITHTPMFLFILLYVLWVIGVRESTLHGVGIGIGLHLLLDTISGWGIMWLWPLTDTRVHIDLGVNAPPNLLMIVLLSVGLILLLPTKRRFRTIR